MGAAKGMRPQASAKQHNSSPSNERKRLATDNDDVFMDIVDSKENGSGKNLSPANIFLLGLDARSIAWKRKISKR